MSSIPIRVTESFLEWALAGSTTNRTAKVTHRKGDRVRHQTKADWGIGQVLQDSTGDRTRVFFENAGEKLISGQHVKLQPVSGAEAASDWLDNLDLSPNPGIKYTSLGDSIEYFCEEFPEGFYGERFATEERDYKVKAHELALELLNRDEVQKLNSAGAYGEVCSRAQRLMNATNLVFPNEKMAFKDGLREPDAQEQFAKALELLLYGGGDLRSRFEDYASVLGQIGADKWTIATYFQFFLDPSANMFIKPTVTQNAAAVCRFEINYRPSLNWMTYSLVLRFAEVLRTKIARLKPRDMIDVQSFMWCIAPK